jgi:hypothetical protein
LKIFPAPCNAFTQGPTSENNYSNCKRLARVTE